MVKISDILEQNKEEKDLECEVLRTGESLKEKV